MEEQTQAHNLQASPVNVRLIGIPDECPICHRSVHPKTIKVELLEERKRVQAVFRCTHQECQELFIATYDYDQAAANQYHSCSLMGIAPKHSINHSFPEIICEISPTFVEIYNQAMSAESQDLDQLVGIGLRKALEFLIKDFSLMENPGKNEDIRKINLGNCISTFIDDQNIKKCAERAVWLGNDETHYTRKWEDKDIKDLKVLMRLTVNWVENKVLTSRYIEEMPK